MKNFSRQIGKNKQRPAMSLYHRAERMARRDIEEFGPGKHELLFCEKGDAVYYHKAWHHHFEDFKHLKENKGVRFGLCPYHQMEKQGVYEGEVRISKIKPEKLGEILAVAKSFGHKAYIRDPMDRIMKIKQEGDKLQIYTSENQLAVRLAKKISEDFKKHFTKPKIHKSKREDPFVITMEMIQK